MTTVPQMHFHVALCTSFLHNKKITLQINISWLYIYSIYFITTLVISEIIYSKLLWQNKLPQKVGLFRVITDRLNNIFHILAISVLIPPIDNHLVTG